MSTSALAKGLAAGAFGVAVMTAVEKVEQSLTGRPNSFVPAHTLERLLVARAARTASARR
jgi:hypothetical protein